MLTRKFSTKVVAIIGLVTAVMLVSSFAAMAQNKEATKAKHEMKMKMEGLSTFLIISPHTADQCLATLDAVSATGKGALAKWDWGCMSGDHTGYMITHAADETAALKMVPESIRAQAKAIKLNKFTAEQLKGMHAKKS